MRILHTGRQRRALIQGWNKTGMFLRKKLDRPLPQLFPPPRKSPNLWLGARERCQDPCQRLALPFLIHPEEKLNPKSRNCRRSPPTVRRRMLQRRQLYFLPMRFSNLFQHHLRMLKSAMGRVQLQGYQPMQMQTNRKRQLRWNKRSLKTIHA